MTYTMSISSLLNPNRLESLPSPSNQTAPTPTISFSDYREVPSIQVNTHHVNVFQRIEILDKTQESSSRVFQKQVEGPFPKQSFVSSAIKQNTSVKRKKPSRHVKINEEHIKKRKITYDNGDVYEGEMANGNFHGKGKMTLKNGDSYEGEYVNGFPHGKGKITFMNGDVYEGEVSNGEPHGKGKMRLKNGNTYEGEYSNGRPHGKGKITLRTGDILSFEGEFANCQAHGRGIIIYQNGESYEGEFSNGQPHGEGKMTDRNGRVKEMVFMFGHLQN